MAPDRISENQPRPHLSQTAKMEKEIDRGFIVQIDLTGARALRTINSYSEHTEHYLDAEPTLEEAGYNTTHRAPDHTEITRITTIQTRTLNIY